MEKNSVLHIRIQEKDKKRAEEVYNNMGTSLSEATRIFVKQSILYHGFPFHFAKPSDRGKLRAKGALRAYADKALHEMERQAWIESLSDPHGHIN